MFILKTESPHTRSYISIGGGGADSGVGEGHNEVLFDDPEPDHDESSLGLISMVPPTGYSLTSGLLARVCCINAT